MQYIYLLQPHPTLQVPLIHFFFTRCCFTSESDSTHVANEDRECKKKFSPAMFIPIIAKNKPSKPKFFRTQSPRITIATTCCATYASSGWYRYPKSSAHPAHAHSWATIRKDRFLHRWRSAASRIPDLPCLRCINRPSSSLQHPSRPSPISATTKQSKPVRSLRA